MADIIGIFTELWFIWFIAIPLLFIYFKFKSNENTANLSINDMAIVLEYGFYILLIYLIEHYLFPQHNYFLLVSIPLTGFYMIFIFIILSKNDIYVIESCIMGDEFYDLDKKQVIYATHTTHKLLKMDRSVYETKKHVGDLANPFWQGTDNLKFCDRYAFDTFFHNADGRLHNINFSIARSFWLLIKELWPKLEAENVELTWLGDIRSSRKMRGIAENYEGQLLAVNEQTEKIPFHLPDNMEKVKEMLKNEKFQSPNQSEENISKGDDEN